MIEVQWMPLTNDFKRKFNALAILVSKGKRWTPARWNEELLAAGFPDLVDSPDEGWRSPSPPSSPPLEV